MDVVGWLLFVGIIVVLVPLLPFILLLWLVSVLVEFVHRQTRGG